MKIVFTTLAKLSPSVSLWCFKPSMILLACSIASLTVLYGVWGIAEAGGVACAGGVGGVGGVGCAGGFACVG